MNEFEERLQYLTEKGGNYQVEHTEFDVKGADRIIHNIDVLCDKLPSRQSLLEKKQFKEGSVDEDIQSMLKKLSGGTKKAKSPNAKLLISGMFSLLMGAYYLSREYEDDSIKTRALATIKGLISTFKSQ